MPAREGALQCVVVGVLLLGYLGVVQMCNIAISGAQLPQCRLDDAVYQPIAAHPSAVLQAACLTKLSAPHTTLTTCCGTLHSNTS